MQAKYFSLPLLLVGAIFLACCKPSGVGPTEISSQQTPQAIMEHIAIAAHKCWFKSGDKAFQSYHMAPELNSYSGRPRILVVPAKNPGERPLLVVEAEGKPAKVSFYGKLMGGPEGGRIAKDIDRWVQGGNQC